VLSHRSQRPIRALMRISTSRTATVLRVVALLSLAAGLAIEGHWWALGLTPIGAGFLIWAVAFRRKVRPSSDALYTAPADRLSDRGKKLPGQLSLTHDGIIWSPTRYATRRGAKPISFGRADASFTVDRGTALFDAIVTINPHEEKGRIRLVTRRTHRLFDLLAPTANS
jgi:hypothetical protein